MKVGIAGLNGRLVSRIARFLLDSSPGLMISGYCRTPSKVPLSISSSQAVTIRDGSAFDLDNMKALVKDCDVVICGYQGPDEIMLEGQKTLIDACEDQGVSRYVASDWTLDYTRLEYGQLWTKEPMKDVMAHVNSKTRVKGVHILNGIFMETFFSPFFNLYDSAERKFRVWGDGSDVWEGTTYESAARWTTEIVLNRDTVGIIRLVGDSKSLHEIVQSHKEVHNTSHAELVHLGSLDDLYEQMHSLRTRSPSEWFVYMPMFYAYYMLHNGQTRVGPQLDNNKYPTVTATSWEQYIRERPLEKLGEDYQPHPNRK